MTAKYNSKVDHLSSYRIKENIEIEKISTNLTPFDIWALKYNKKLKLVFLLTGINPHICLDCQCINKMTNIKW